MVGIWHWHIPTFFITDISPPWRDFVMVGICRQAMTMMTKMMIMMKKFHSHGTDGGCEGKPLSFVWRVICNILLDHLSTKFCIWYVYVWTSDENWLYFYFWQASVSSTFPDQSVRPLSVMLSDFEAMYARKRSRCMHKNEVYWAEAVWCEVYPTCMSSKLWEYHL